MNIRLTAEQHHDGHCQVACFDHCRGTIRTSWIRCIIQWLDLCLNGVVLVASYVQNTVFIMPFHYHASTYSRIGKFEGVQLHLRLGCTMLVRDFQLRRSFCRLPQTSKFHAVVFCGLKSAVIIRHIYDRYTYSVCSFSASSRSYQKCRHEGLSISVSYCATARCGNLNAGLALMPDQKPLEQRRPSLWCQVASAVPDICYGTHMDLTSVGVAVKTTGEIGVE